MDKDGKLSDAEKEHISAWIGQRWSGQKECPVCGHPKWMLGQHLLRIDLFRPGGTLRLGGDLVAYVALFCQNCGNARHFNASMIDELMDMINASILPGAGEGDEHV